MTLRSMMLALVFALVGCGSSAPKPAASTSGPATEKQTPTEAITAPDAPDPGDAQKAESQRSLAVAKQWRKAYTSSDWTALAALYADGAVVTPAGSGMRISGTKKIVNFLSHFSRAFPDAKMEPGLLAVRGETVVSMVKFQGTNTGEMMPGMKPTNKRASFVGLSIAELKDGKIVKQVLYADNLNFMRQLGVWKGTHRKLGTEPLPKGIVVADFDAAEKKRVAHIEKYQALFNAGNVKGLAGLYISQATLNDHHQSASTSGSGGINGYYSGLFGSFAGPKLSDYRVWAIGTRVISTYVFTAQVGGKPVKVPVASVFEFGEHDAIQYHSIFVDGMVIGMQTGALTFPPKP